MAQDIGIFLIGAFLGSLFTVYTMIAREDDKDDA